MRTIRVLVGKPGLDGHDRGAKVVAAALRDAGMEVIYTGLHQSAGQIVEAGLQEDVDVVALSILSGAHMTLFPDVLAMMRDRGLGDRLLTGGGIIPAEDMDTLSAMGVGRLFGPGSSTQDIARYIREWFQRTHPGEELAPMPEPASPASLVEPVGEPVPVPAPAHHSDRRAATRPARRSPAGPRPGATPRRTARSSVRGGGGAVRKPTARKAAGKRTTTAGRTAATRRGQAAGTRRKAVTGTRRTAAARRSTAPRPARRSTARRPARRGRASGRR
jgi:methylmalonyl-CoA mutase, C-terminal domain